MTAAEGMAKVLSEHLGPYYMNINTGYCGCSKPVGGDWTTGECVVTHRAHVADALAAAGYGLLADAWDEGYVARWTADVVPIANPYRKDQS